MRSVHLNPQLAILVPPWKHNTKLSHNHVSVPSNRTKFILHSISSSLKDDLPSSVPNQRQLRYDPSEDLYGLDVDTPSRDVRADASEPRSWFGPNGQYIKELPCPSCRGRGYTPCTECGIERSRQDCSLCSGKGLITCQRCMGERVIWEESIDEKPWEKARSVSPLKVKEDDEVDDLEFNLDTRKKSKRIYRSPPPEVGLKISRSLKSLNAKTGLFSKRMKIIHRDPALHAQRVAAIKKAKQKPAARKHASETLKTFFSDPENRRKRSISMKGVKFFCKNCGREGHRSFYCPELRKGVDRRFRCRLCGERGHNRRTCQKPKTSTPKQRVLRQYHCHICGQVGHNRRTCPVKTEVQSGGAPTLDRESLKDSKGHVRKSYHYGHNRRSSKKPKTSTKQRVLRHYHCHICGQVGHNSRTCSVKTEAQVGGAPTRDRESLKDSEGHVRKSYHCHVCGQTGHNKRTCPKQLSKKHPDLETTELGSSLNPSRRVRRPYKCSICHVHGHNQRTCSERTAQ